MFNNNRHLNIFEHYSQKNSLPIENNVSRGLAILLNEDHLLFDRFIDYLNDKMSELNSEIKVAKPISEEDTDIGIQQNITQIANRCDGILNLIGITLTTTKDIKWKKNRKVNSKLITDIAIICNDTLIIIEVKRNEADARNQLKQQVNSIIVELIKKDEEFVPEKILLDGTWEEIINMMQGISSLSSNSNTILNHYLGHLEKHYPEWFPTLPFSKIDINKENEVLINKRIHKLIVNCCEKDDDEKKYSGRYIIPLDYNFATEAQIRMDYDEKQLLILIWFGDTKWQGWNLLNNNKSCCDFHIFIDLC